MGKISHKIYNRKARAPRLQMEEIRRQKKLQLELAAGEGQAEGVADAEV